MAKTPTHSAHHLPQVTSPHHEPWPSGHWGLVSSPLTGDAEAILRARFLQGEEPCKEPTDGQEGQEGTGSRLGHPADGRVGSPIAAHDVGVEVDVLEADGCASHRQAPAHLPVEAVHSSWAGRWASLAVATQL